MANLGRGVAGAGAGAQAGSAAGPYGALIGGIIGGVGGMFSGDDHEDQIREMQNAALEEIRNIQVPELKQLVFEKYKSAGILTPEMESTIMQEDSGMKGIATDPRLKDAQMSALAKLQEVGKGGLQASDIAAMDQAKRAAAVDAQAKQNQILQSLQERGQGGSGSELAARLSGAQAGANRVSGQDLDIAGRASQNALQSMINAGNLGGTIRGQDFSENAQIAQAQDAINRFNASNRQAVGNQNVNRGNYGKQYNLQEAQNLSNSNVDLGRQQQIYNQNIQQRNFENQLRKTDRLAGAYTGRGAGYMGEDQRSDTRFNQAIGGVSNMGQGAKSYGMGKSGGNNSSGNSATDFDSTGSESQGGSGWTGGNNAQYSNYAYKGGMIKNYDDGGVVPNFDQGGMMPDMNQLIQLAPLAMMLLKDGGKVPGHAEVPGDSPINDTVHALVSPGEIVIPRSLVNHGDDLELLKFIHRMKKGAG